MGTGIPDSLFGAARSAIYRDFGVPVGWASIISIIIAVGTIIESLNAAKAVYRLRTRKVAPFGTSLSIPGFSLSRNFLWLTLFSVPIGFGAGAIDAALLLKKTNPCM